MLALSDSSYVTAEPLQVLPSKASSESNEVYFAQLPARIKSSSFLASSFFWLEQITN